MSNDKEYVMIDEQEEAEFIQNYLLKSGKGFIDVEDIKSVIYAQLQYLVSIGVATREEE